MKKALGITLNILIVIVVLIVIVSIYSVIQVKMLNKSYVNFFGYATFQVATGSMSGEMEVKDIIIANILNEEKKQELKVDDIVVFQEGNNLITHRIIEIDGDNITTKGDANNTADVPIKKDDVIAKVVKVVRNIAIWEKVFTTPQVYISIIVTITLFGITFAYSKKES